MYYAITELADEDENQSMKLYVNEELRLTGSTTTITNPMIESGIIHARALLQFMGLTIDPTDSTKLKERQYSGRSDDLNIEDFSNGSEKLSTVTVQDVMDCYPGPEEEAEGSIARIIHVANKEIAHTTYGREISDDDYTMLEIGARGIRALITNFFFHKLGLSEPQSPVRLDKIASLRREAEKNNTQCQVNLGYYYHKGENVPKNDTEAARWFLRAAELGDPKGQYNSGIMYHNGWGVPKDFSTAIKWYSQAATLGESAALYNLGVMYEKGQGVNRDYIESYNYYHLAFCHGYQDARKALSELTEKMTAEQIDLARRRISYRTPGTE